MSIVIAIASAALVLLLGGGLAGEVARASDFTAWGGEIHAIYRGAMGPDGQFQCEFERFITAEEAATLQVCIVGGSGHAAPDESGQ